MALHLPLTNARIAAFSTHTADPEFVARAQEFFSSALSYPLKFLNPYLYLTKVEVVNRLPRVLRSVIPQSVSCWRASRIPSKNHCGDCVPCLVRRIALESNGISLAEYSHDLFREDVGSLPPDNLGKRNLIELMMFIVRFESLAATDQMGVQEQYPELINSHIDLAAAIQMYKRFAAEARKVFDNYPALRTLLR
jgi:hypothetical protein